MLHIQCTVIRNAQTANQNIYLLFIMDDQYYSKKLEQYFPTRLDVMLYAHDGRGLGHASRAIAIGMGLRRLYPELRILFVTGAAISQSLIGNANLDWVKLPSYASTIIDGVSTGVNGPANFYKSVLGKHRQEMLRGLIASFKPRCLLVDHNPLGKRKELLEALELAKEVDTRCILGLRAIIGTQNDFWNDELRDTYQKYYSDILWYGDSNVSGTQQLDKINSHFECQAKEMGYVSRLFETRKLTAKNNNNITGTVSIPWFSEESQHFIHILQQVLSQRSNNEKWNIFINKDEVENVRRQFKNVNNCTIKAVGEEYAESIIHSKMAIIYGGYNSLMDICAAQIPALILQRNMKDQEQEIHIQQLIQQAPETYTLVKDAKPTPKTLEAMLTKLLAQQHLSKPIRLDGSIKTADFLHSFVKNK